MPDDDVPPLGVVRGYLADRRADLLAHLRGLSAADLDAMPATAYAKAVYREGFQVLALHEAHHHGQARLTLNPYRAARDARDARPGRPGP